MPPRLSANMRPSGIQWVCGGKFQLYAVMIAHFALNFN